jgi:hypothetical protein
MNPAAGAAAVGSRERRIEDEERAPPTRWLSWKQIEGLGRKHGLTLRSGESRADFASRAIELEHGPGASRGFALASRDRRLNDRRKGDRPQHVAEALARSRVSGSSPAVCDADPAETPATFEQVLEEVGAVMRRFPGVDPSKIGAYLSNRHSVDVIEAAVRHHQSQRSAP